MPPLIRRYIKTSFVFLLTGVALGAYIVVGEFVLGVYPPRLHITAHVHLLLVGFMLMLVMGVATWTFPRPARDDARYRPELAAAVYWLMTAGTGAGPRRAPRADRGRARAPAPDRPRRPRPGRGDLPVRGEHVVAGANAERAVAARPLSVRADGRDVDPRPCISQTRPIE